MIRYGTGLLCEPEGLVATPVRILLGRSSVMEPPPFSNYLEQFMTDIEDQGSTSRCVGFATARAIQLRTAALGYPTKASANGIYTYARCIDRPDMYQGLVDFGSMPSKAFLGMQEWGIPTEEHWPSLFSTVNNEPDFENIKASSSFRVSGWYKIETGDTKSIRQAIALGYPVTVGAYVDDEDFFDYRGGIIGDMRASVGGHYMCVVSYRTLDTGIPVYRLCNSWGAGWGEDGMCEVTDLFLSKCFSCYAMRII